MDRSATLLKSLRTQVHRVDGSYWVFSPELSRRGTFMADQSVSIWKCQCGLQRHPDDMKK